MEVRNLSEQTNQQDGNQAAPGSAGDAGSQDKPTRPEWLPEAYFDAEAGSIKLEDFGKHYGELTASTKAEADRLAAYPQKVDDLKIDLPADVKLPDGVKFDATNPAFAGFRQFVFDKKIDPSVAGEMLGMYAKAQIADVDAINARVDEESKKLGANGPSRIAAVETALAGKFGKTEAAALMSGVFRADQVQVLEKIVLALANGGSTSPTNTSRDDAPETGKIEGYEGMTFMQRRLAQMNQKAATGGK